MATSAVPQAAVRSSSASVPRAAPRGIRRSLGETTVARLPDRINDTVTATTFRDLDRIFTSTGTPL
jgi:hypothetical protein